MANDSDKSREQLLQALRESEAQYRRIVEMALEGIWTVDRNFRIVFVNQRMAQLLGYTPEEIIGRPVITFMLPEEMPDHEKRIQSRMDGVSEQYERRFRRKDGEVLTMLVSATVLTDESGRFNGAFGMFSDITARKRLEEELQEERKLFIGGPVVSIQWKNSEGWPVEYASPNLLNQFGYRPEDLASSRIQYFELIHPEDNIRVLEEIQWHIASGTAWFEQEYRIRRYDGEWRWVHDFTTAVRNARGEITHYHRYMEDITPRKQAEDSLRRRIAFEEMVTRISTRFSSYTHAEIDGGIERALQEIATFNNVESAFVALIAPDMKTWNISHEWRAPGFPRSKSEFQNVPLDRFAWSARLILGGEPIKINKISDHPAEARAERELCEHEGVRSLLVLPLHGQGGKIKGCLGFEALTCERNWSDDDVRLLQMICDLFANALERKFADEARRNLELQVQQAQKLESLGVLAGGIAHDFNNLLMTILGNADLALSEMPPESAARGSLHEIESASRRAAELCKQMLAYSGKGRFLIEPIHLSRLVEEMGHMLEVSISKKAVLRYRFADNLPTVEADATQIRQIVMNLIINASEAIGDKSGIISVTTGAMECDPAYLASAYLDENLPGGLYVYLEVADTGCGMNEETRAKIFDPFFTTKFTGRGLGLAAVLGIVRGHNGAIKVYSEPGRGTSFKIIFPASQMGAVEDSGEEKPIQWRGSGTVLIVDDEESVRALAKRMVERCGFTVLTASDGQEALKIYRKCSDETACILLDLTMPHMDGEETFRELRRMRPDVRVILSSGYNEQEVTQRFTGKGLAGFIQKPYQMATLTEKLRKALTKAD